MSSYSPYYPTWKDDPDHTTPIIAAALNNMEAGIALGVAAGGGGVDYKGNYNAGTAYAQGDVVLYNGVQYVCVNPGTGQTPPGFQPIVTSLPVIGIGTALPTSGLFDGMEFILTDSLTAPTYSWRFRYVSGKSTNKWVFIGGAPAISAAGASADPIGTSFVAISGVTLAVPVAGDYLVTPMLEVQASGSIAAGRTGYGSFDCGAYSATDANGTKSVVSTVAQSFVSIRTVSAALPAGTLRFMGRADGANARLVDCRLLLEPRAVGG